MRARFTSTDLLLLLVVSIWGSNFTVVKAAIEQIPPLGFNGLRLVIACVVLVAASWLSGARIPDRADWPRLVAVGLVGHCGYQLSFIQGLARTSVTNSSLILGCLPVTVLLLNAVSRRRERIGRWQWVGVYLVVGVGAQTARDTLGGDLTIMLSVWCWGWYTVGSRGLLRSYTPLHLTAYTTVIGTVAFVPFAMPTLLVLDWPGVSWWAWAAVVASGVLALSVSYVLWYTGVQRLGSARTSVYSNLVPVVAMVVAAVALQEPIGAVKVAGAALVLTALATTRIGSPSRAG